MTVYTYTEARRKLADVLDRASNEGEVVVRRRDGREYVVRPREPEVSPLDIDPIEASEGHEPISREEIVRVVRESRERSVRESS